VNRVQPASYPGFLPTGTIAIVKVVVGVDGIVKDASIYNTSGYPGFDAQAILAAKATTYSRKMIDCKPAQGVYLLEETFTPDVSP
jgi:TonB family protein